MYWNAMWTGFGLGYLVIALVDNGIVQDVAFWCELI